MTSINEPQGTQMFGALSAGLDVLDLDQEVTFQAFTRVVLPIDGYVFWTPTVPLTVQGSLHYSQTLDQLEDETPGGAEVVFSAKAQVTEFSNAPINTIYVGSIGSFLYAFVQQGGFYTQAGIWHYSGQKIPSAMLSQLLISPTTIDPTQAVVSNSLPLWLAMNTYQNPYSDQWNLPTGLTLYPSFLVPPNMAPPYGVVHIGEEDTEPLQATQTVDINSRIWQLCADNVRVTLYGLQNQDALRFVNFVNRFTLNTNSFGIMNMPVVRDAKRTLPEIQALAMKKVIDFRISYHQYTAQTIGRQLILNALPIKFYFEEMFVPIPTVIDILATGSGAPVVTGPGQEIQVGTNLP
jgi:hypothetical protein